MKNLLTEIQNIDKKSAEPVYLPEGCMSLIVIAGIIDFTKEADRTFQKFIAV